MARRRYQTRAVVQEPADLHLALVRVSTDEQVEKGNSLEEQTDWALDDAGRAAPGAPVTTIRANDYGIIEGGAPERDGREHVVVVSEEGLTSAFLERPGLSILRDLIRAGRVISFRAIKLDRISRDVGHQQLVLSEVIKYRVRLTFRDFGEYTGSPLQHAMLSNIGVWAQLERAMIRERTMSGKRKLAAKGRLTHWPGTYGLAYDKETKAVSFDTEPALPGRPEVGTKADVVRLMYEWALKWDDASFHGIARRLNELGVISPRGSVWQKMTVKRILSNTAYKGVMYLQRYNTAGVKFNKLRPPEDRLSTTIRPQEEWREVRIPALIDEVTWERVQQRLNAFRRRRPGNPQAPYLLSGLIVCGRCQSTVHGNLITQPRKKQKYRYYCCTARSPGIEGMERCTQPFTPADELEEKVWQTVREWVLNPDALAEVLQTAARDETGPRRELKLTEEAIVAARDEESEVLDLRRKRLLTRETAEDQLSQLQARLASLTRRTQVLRGQIEAAAGGTQAQRDLWAFIEDMRDQIDTLNFAGRQALVRRLVSEVILDGDDVRLVINLMA